MVCIRQVYVPCNAVVRFLVGFSSYLFILVTVRIVGLGLTPAAIAVLEKVHAVGNGLTVPASGA